MLGAALRLRLRVLRRRCLRGQRRRRRSRGGRAAVEGGGREPVLLVSGMGGSVLHARRRSNPKFDLRVWVRILFANLDFKKYLWSLYNADTGGFARSSCATGHHMGCPCRWRLNRAGEWFSEACFRLLACSCAGYVEPLDDDVEIVVPEDDHGLYAIDVLDPSWVSSRVFGSMED